MIPYYERFLARFPDVAALAARLGGRGAAALERAGLLRARRATCTRPRARSSRHGGISREPQRRSRELPGIGRSTAAAIAAFAFGERAAILDGNVKRVLARRFGVGCASTRPLGAGRASCCRSAGIEAYTQGLMDLGAHGLHARAGLRATLPGQGATASRARRTHRRAAGAAREKPLPLQARDAGSCFSTTARCCWSGGRRRGSGAGCGASPSAGRRDAGSRAGCRLIEHGFTHFRLRIQPLLCSDSSAARIWTAWTTPAARRSRRLSEVCYSIAGIATRRGGRRR